MGHESVSRPLADMPALLQSHSSLQPVRLHAPPTTAPRADVVGQYWLAAHWGMDFLLMWTLLSGDLGSRGGM